MSYSNFDEYLANLSKKVKDLQHQIDHLEKLTIEQGLAFELKKKDLYAETAANLRGYKPAGTELNINTNFDSQISSEEITKILSLMYKLN